MGFQHKQRHPIAIALISLAALAACTQSITERQKDSDMTSSAGEALAMQRAARQAQATLDDFLTKAGQLPAGTTAYAVKIAIQEGLQREYFWVNEFRWSDGTFVGKIDSEPRLVTGIKPGQMHKFSRADIVDWRYVDEKSGRTVGNFSESLQ